MTASQIEFPLAVSVCAWCKPKEQGAAIGSLSHGICLRHLKKLKLQSRGLLVKRPRRGARAVTAQLECASKVLPLAF
jgi:hypothetical protein